MNRIDMLSLAFSSRAKIIFSPTVGVESDDGSSGSFQGVGTSDWKVFVLGGVGIYPLVIHRSNQLFRSIVLHLFEP